MNKKNFVGLLPLALVLAPALASAEVNQPQEIVARPLTTPGGQITVGGDVGLLSLKLIDRTTSIGLGLSGAYGVSDDLEVGASYGFSLKEFEIKGDLNVNAAYSILKGNLSLAADVGFGYNVNGEALDPLTLGAEVRFNVNDQLAIYSPGHQLSIGLESPNAMALGLPVAVGYQVNKQIFAHVDTSIGTIALKEGDSAFIFADYIPLQVGAFFSPSNTLDIGAAIDFLDLKHAGDAVGVIGSVRLHM